MNSTSDTMLYILQRNEMTVLAFEYSVLIQVICGRFTEKRHGRSTEETHAAYYNSVISQTEEDHKNLGKVSQV